MTKQKTLSIVAFVGLTGSGKTTATDYLADQGTPRIKTKGTAAAIDEITGLFNAGQRLISLDDLNSWDQYLKIKQAFPGRLSVVALVAPENLRHRWLGRRSTSPLSIHEANQKDHAILAASQKAEPIAAADYTIINDGGLDSLYTKIDEIITEIRSCKSTINC